MGGQELLTSCDQQKKVAGPAVKQHSAQMDLVALFDTTVRWQASGQIPIHYPVPTSAKEKQSSVSIAI